MSVAARDVDRLSHEAELFKNVVDHIPQGVFVKDANDDCRYLIWNKGMENRFGIKASEALGKTDAEIFPSAEAKRLARLDSFVMSQGSTLDIPEETIQVTSQQFPAHTVRVPLYGDSGKLQLLLGIVEDLTEKNRYDEQLRDQQAKLMQSARLSTLGELSAGVAHEINNPIAVIKGFAGRIEMKILDGSSNDAETIRCVRTIFTMVDRVARITRSLLTFARDGTNDPFEATTVQSIIVQTLELCGQRLSIHEIELRQTATDSGLQLECRGVEVSQVLLNLLNNAFYAVKDLKERWVRIETRDLGNDLEFSVTDSGSGIPRDIAVKVLNPFFTTKQVGEGSGLGLSVSMGIVKRHGGRLYYDDTSKNTRFVFVLPKSQAKKVA